MRHYFYDRPKMNNSVCQNPPTQYWFWVYTRQVEDTRSTPARCDVIVALGCRRNTLSVPGCPGERSTNVGEGNWSPANRLGCGADGRPSGPPVGRESESSGGRRPSRAARWVGGETEGRGGGGSRIHCLPNRNHRDGGEEGRRLQHIGAGWVTGFWLDLWPGQNVPRKSVMFFFTLRRLQSHPGMTTGGPIRQPKRSCNNKKQGVQ